MFQYFSDLHLENIPGFRLKKGDVKAPYLILAGDIGDPCSNEYKCFLEHCITLYDKTFLILGNHEAYKKESWEYTIHITRKLIKLIDKEQDRLIFLENDPYYLDERITILGCTLWSFIDIDNMSEIQQCINDYKQIGATYKLTTHDTNDMHLQSVNWLKNCLIEAQCTNKICVVITHHAPLMTGTSDPKYEAPDRKLSQAFASDLSDLFEEYNDVLRAWIHGHTHYSHNSCVNNIKLVSNQKGYSFEQTKFRRDIDPIYII
jgi:Icc-related predicted phosphoesterase